MHLFKSMKTRTQGSASRKWRRTITTTIATLFILSCIAVQEANAAETTVTFTTSDADSIWLNGIAEKPVNGIVLQEYNFSNSSNPAASMISDPLNIDDGYTNTLTSYSADSGSGWKGMAIGSKDGTEFQINGFFYSNWGLGTDDSPITIHVDGYRNGTIVTNTSFTASQIVNGFQSQNVTLGSAFDNVDMVALYSSGTSWHGINNILIDNAVSPPSISSQPSNATVIIGGIASFSVTATGVAPLSYQWQLDSGSGFSNISGKTRATLNMTTVTASMDGYKYRVVITDGNSLTTTSNAATLTVNPATTTTTLTAAPNTLIAGETVTLTTTVSAASGTPTGTVTFIDGETPLKTAPIVGGTASFTTSSLGVGTHTITAAYSGDGSLSGSTSTSVTVTVNTALSYSIATIGNQTATALLQGYVSSEPKIINVTNIGTGKLSNLMAALSGTNADDFTIMLPDSTLNSGVSTSIMVKARDGLSAGTYTATVTVSADLMTNVTFTITQVVNLPDAPAIPQNLVATGGDHQVLLTWNTVTGATYYNLYMSIIPDQFSNPPIATATFATYNVQNLINGTTYYFVVKSGDLGGLSAISNQVEATPATVPAVPTSSTSGGGSAPAAALPAFDLNGITLDPGSIDLTKPSITLKVTPKDGTGTAYVNIPASILTSFAGKNASFFIDIQAPYGGYQIPVNLASLIPGLAELLTKNNLSAEDISFKITLTDKSGDKDIKAASANGFPNGKVMGAVVDFHIEIINNKTGQFIGAADQFSKALTRVIPMPKNVTVIPEQWGAFRYNETTKTFEFIAARMVEIDGVWVAMISSYSNSIYAVVQHASSFSDVGQHWSRPFVELAAAKGLVEGVGGGQYDPDNSVTRAEFTAMLVRALGRGTAVGSTARYDDVKPDAWYFSSVSKAQELGLLGFVKGHSFMPNQPLTREEMASMLAAVTKLEKLQISKEMVSLDGYKDIGSVDATYLDDVRLMVTLQIMTGTGQVTFSPKGDTTRAQAAVVFIRTLESLGMMD